MWYRRIIYLTTLVGSLVFYGFYREWFSWFLLMLVLVLPWFSLALSLPAMGSVQAKLRCPELVRAGAPVRTALELACKYPTPPVSSRIRLRNTLTGARYVGAPGERIPTGHCGMLTISYDRIFVYDYLGLFCRQLRKGDSCNVFVEPKPVPGIVPPGAQDLTVTAFRPKPGGGYSEHHDLRLFRPGDEPRNLHYKLSAKTGKLIYREPLEPVRRGCLITLTLCGTPRQLDKKLGQLVFAAQSMLADGLSFHIRCITGDGPLDMQISDHLSWEEGLHTILRSTPAKQEQLPQKDQTAAWQHHIGGDHREA